MNFFKELEKKKKCFGFWEKDEYFYQMVFTEDIPQYEVLKKDCFPAIPISKVKELYKESQRSFWEKRREEIEKKIAKLNLCLEEEEQSRDQVGECYYSTMIETLKNELFWIEKQLGEKEKKEVVRLDLSTGKAKAITEKQFEKQLKEVKK